MDCTCKMYQAQATKVDRLPQLPSVRRFVGYRSHPINLHRKFVDLASQGNWRVWELLTEICEDLLQIACGTCIECRRNKSTASAILTYFALAILQETIGHKRVVATSNLSASGSLRYT